MPTKTDHQKLKPWFKNGTHPNEYDYDIDDDVTYKGKRAVFLRSTVDHTHGFGGFMQNFKADRYWNKRMKFSAAVKANNVESWAGLWMRVDGNGGEMLQFDNMEKRAIEGTKDWGMYHVVLNIPKEAKGIYFGILMDGKGQVWISDVKFEETTDASTNQEEEMSDEPGNLDFSSSN